MKRENFTLKSVKIKDHTTMEIKFVESFVHNDEAHQQEHTVTSTLPPHKHLTDAFKGLKEVVYVIMGYNSVDVLAKAKQSTHKQQEAFKTLSAMLEKLKKEQLDNLDPYAIHISGSNNDKIKISCKRKTEQGTVAFNTPLMMMDADVFGIEDDLLNIVSVVVEEVFEYTVNKKSVQLSAIDA